MAKVLEIVDKGFKGTILNNVLWTQEQIGDNKRKCQ